MADRALLISSFFFFFLFAYAQHSSVLFVCVFFSHACCMHVTSLSVSVSFFCAQSHRTAGKHRRLAGGARPERPCSRARLEERPCSPSRLLRDNYRTIPANSVHLIYTS
uniref:Secreted protein n=1 Tax=Zea mays TaxID=4577 RepID=B6T530_MAIZE|nr:hypothetical protein [Zea mays]